MKGNKNVYVFIVKKLKDHIKIVNIMKLAIGKQEDRWPYIAHLSARAHKYTHLRHEESNKNLTIGFGRNILKFLLYYIEKYVDVKSTSTK